MLASTAVGLVSTNAAAIVDGKEDETSSVVSLGPATDPICSGTVIGRRLVVTAAHCLTTTDIRVNVDGKRLGVAFTKVHPDFDEKSLAHDIGLIILSEDAPVTPMRFRTSVPAEGDRVRFIGWGKTGQDTASKGRRAGVAKVDAIESAHFKTVPDPSNACGRDSGGAVLDEDGTTLVGVISSGDTSCQKHTFATRLDENQAFLDETVAGTENSGCRASGASSSGSAGAFFVLAALVGVAKRRLVHRAQLRAESIG